MPEKSHRVSSSLDDGVPAHFKDDSVIADSARLAALHAYGIMGSESEAMFDDIARLVAKVFRTPAAFVVFVDGTQQFFKASVGADSVREAIRHSRFCSFTIAKEDALIIPDALADPLYADSPVVTDTPPVRFYAGMPVRSSEGYALGTVCVVDHEPHILTDDQFDYLRFQARQVERLLALRLSGRKQSQAIEARSDVMATSGTADAEHQDFDEVQRQMYDDNSQAQERLSASEAALREREERIKSLYEMTSRSDIGFEEKVQNLLRVGRDWLGLDTAVLAHTDCEADLYTIVQIDAKAPAIAAGFTCPLEHSFCSEVLRGGADSPPLAVEHLGASETWRDHPAHRLFGCEAYHGAVVRVGGKAWGALAFSSTTPHQTPFTNFDKDMVRLMAQWIGGELARQEAEEALRTNVAKQRRFVREMLASVTEGKLRLCDDPQDLPDTLPPASAPVELKSATLRLLRKHVKAVADALQFTAERTHDLLTAVGEASMNAVTHGGGGGASIYADAEHRVVQVRIQDHGEGIREEDLHRATLEKGWSGGGSLGHGFFLMLRTVDRTYLLTGTEGTTVVLEQEATPPQPAWAQ